jgi:hypothetical protein
VARAASIVSAAANADWAWVPRAHRVGQPIEPGGDPLGGQRGQRRGVGGPAGGARPGGELGVQGA